MLASFLLFASAVGVIKSLMFVIFILVAMLMILIVLLQEPKGGGLSGAFGGVGAETFGVQTGGVNKFTSVLAAIFLTLALFYAAIDEDEPDAPSSVTTKEIAAPSGDGVTGDGVTDDGTGLTDDGKKEKK